MYHVTLDEWLERGVDKIYPSKEAFQKLLKSKKPLKIYIGVDATGPQMHLGHATNFLILKKIQELGHKIFFLVGDFTAMIGDPTDKMATRQPLTHKEVLANCKNYKQQIEKIISFSDKNFAEIKFNSKWLGALKFKDIIELSSNFTVQQMLERDMFQERIKNDKPIGLHEFLYPLMQGYDSVVMNIDVEMGGRDQTFNMLVGRTLMSKLLNKEKFVISTKLLENPNTGKKLMNKSEGSYIAMDDNPSVMYGKVMSLPDEVVSSCFNLCTELSNREISKIVTKNNSLRNQKARLAFEIVNLYHTIEEAQLAETEFNRVFRDKELPIDIPEVKIRNPKCEDLPQMLFDLKLATSKSDARRLIEQGGVRIDKAVISDYKADICFHDKMVIQVGKLKFVRVRL